MFGDIGTSPLYALQTALGQFKGAALGPPEVIGVVSLIIWALLIVVTAKYVLFLMQADNKGEGGILSLMALAQRALGQKTTIAFLLGVAGAALFSGDAMITPAISVLSALEGLKQVDADLARYILPATIVILVLLFAAQSRGTARVAAFFSPIMVVFFAVNAALGIAHIASDWSILQALSPIPGLGVHPCPRDDRIHCSRQRLSGGDRRGSALRRHGPFRTTADPGGLAVHRSAGAGVQLSWPRRADLTNPKAVENPFYLMAPGWGFAPLILLSTAATVIASQAVITGAYSLASQAIQLGLLPRLEIVHTSSTQEGQIFIPRVNRILLVGVLALVLLFRTSEALGNAYGIAVSGTMVVDNFARLLCRLEAVAMVAWAALALDRRISSHRRRLLHRQPLQGRGRRLGASHAGHGDVHPDVDLVARQRNLAGSDASGLDPDAGPDQDAREVEAGPGPGNGGVSHQ